MIEVCFPPHTQEREEGSERVERRVLEKQWEGKEEEENHGGGNTAASELHTLLHTHGL